jgi:hypothetical protein
VTHVLNVWTDDPGPSAVLLADLNERTAIVRGILGPPLMERSELAGWEAEAELQKAVVADTAGADQHLLDQAMDTFARAVEVGQARRLVAECALANITLSLEPASGVGTAAVDSRAVPAHLKRAVRLLRPALVAVLQEVWS